MNEQEIRRKAQTLLEALPIAMMGSLSESGAPQIKALQIAEREGMKHIWFSTGTSSEHVAQLERDGRASLYFVQHDEIPWQGLLLSGQMDVLRDAALRERIWEDGDEKFYPLGVTDPNYTVLRFTAEWAKYYEFGTHFRFDVPPLGGVE